MTDVKISTKRRHGIINKNIYGQFAEHLGRCIYEGIYVEPDSGIENVNGMRTDVVNALKELDIPVLRWPGGCFADDYHWRDGIGDKDKRPYMVNTNWGGVVENNHFGTHEFFELCDQLGCEPYITGNVGSGTVQEMRDWIEYMTFDGDSPLANERRKNGHEEPFKLKYFGVGNENWGCGGGMRPEYYSDLYRRYSTFIRNYGDEPIYKIGCGPNTADTRWMEVVLKNAGGAMQGISWHNYTYEGDWDHKGSSYNFDEKGWYSNLADVERMRDRLKKQIAVMDCFDPDKKTDLIVDEWGNWYDCMPGTNPGFLYQQNTMRDAVTGMVILHMFHQHCDRIQMANIAQMINVLQAMILTEGDKMVLTPTYHLFKMMKGHQDGESVDVDYDSKPYEADGENVPSISLSASVKDGALTITAANTRLDRDEDLVITLDKEYKGAQAQLLTAENMCDFNSFEEPSKVAPVPLKTELDGNKLTVKLPKMSIISITLK